VLIFAFYIDIWYYFNRLKGDFVDANLKRSIILEHYQNPKNRGLIDDESYRKVNMNSKTCIDNLDFACKIENGIIEDLRFDGEACAISTSSASIMSELVKGKTVEEVKVIIENYENMINEKPYDKDILEEANCYDEIYKQPSRKKCALLPYEGLKKILEDN